MDEEKWITAIITATIGSVVVCFLILIINESGKRGQAITWLPASLATTMALTYMNTPDQLERMLTCAFGSTLSSGFFIFSFGLMINTFLTNNNSDGPDEGQKDTMILLISIISVVAGATIVLLVETSANKLWVLILGLFGMGLIMYTVITSPDLVFESNVVTFKISHLFEYIKKCCQRVETSLTQKEINLLLGAIVGTFIFTIIPAWLADVGHPNWAGVLSNMPKVTVLVMISLYFNKGDEKTETNEKRIKLKRELLEHLTMFSYSTGITAIYIIILWFNESELIPEDFWLAWVAGLGISLIFIILILVPVCRKKNGVRTVSVVLRLQRPVSAVSKGLLAPTPLEPNRQEAFQEHQKLKW